jgi:hypothetical protein
MGTTPAGEIGFEKGAPLARTGLQHDCHATGGVYGQCAGHRYNPGANFNLSPSHAGRGKPLSGAPNRAVRFAASAGSQFQ